MSLKIGPKVKSNQIKSSGRPPPPHTLQPTPPPHTLQLTPLSAQILRHQKARVQAVGWTPVGDQ